MKKLYAGMLLALVLVGPGMAAVKSTEYTLLVAPARYSVLQVMFDLVDRHPAVLVSYQGEAATEQPLLHVWNGVSWIAIGLHDLREMTFVQRSPSRVVLVGDDALLPTAVRDALAWAPETVHFRQIDNASLLNESGRVFGWNSRDWRWFATRYNLALEDEAAPMRRSSWFDQPGPLNRPASQAPVVPVPAREAKAPPATLPLLVERPSDAPVPAEVEAAAEIPAETPAEVPAETPVTEPAPAPATATETLDAVVDALGFELAPAAAVPADESAPVK